MKLIKIWWSLLAPKNTVWCDESYCHRFFDRRQQQNFWNCLLIHGVWNIGHGYIKKHGLSVKTYLGIRSALYTLYTYIDRYIWAVRIQPQEIKYVTKESQWSYICGGDITVDLTIISWDQQIVDALNACHWWNAYILTDIDGVLDHNAEVIEIITKDTVADIDFRTIENDITGSMRGKIESLFQWVHYSSIIRIINWNDLENVTRVIKTWQWIWTKVIIS